MAWREAQPQGSQPAQHGRPSHHPLLAMLAEAKLVVHALAASMRGTAMGGVDFRLGFA
jgi:hypothetical protein